MIPLIFLLTTFLLLFTVNTFVLSNQLTLSFIGRASLAVMLLVTGISHFTKTNLMMATMPEFMPLKKETVYVTGVLELLAVVGLLIDRTVEITAVCSIIFFLCILPANIIGSLKQVDLGGMAKGKIYLFFRIPLQIFFILWTYYFGIRIH